MVLDAGSAAAGTKDGALAQDFVQFCVDSGVLRFGEFKTKAGRLSPYFFNAGLFDDGAKLGRLAQFYAQALVASGIEFDMIFGPAYKGIPLGAAVAIELARLGRNVPFAYNRKEAKDHGADGVQRDVEHSAVQYVRSQLGLQVCAIATLADLLHYLSHHTGDELASHRDRVLAYRQHYGVA